MVPKMAAAVSCVHQAATVSSLDDADIYKLPPSKESCSPMRILDSEVCSLTRGSGSGGADLPPRSLPAMSTPCPPPL